MNLVDMVLKRTNLKELNHESANLIFRKIENLRQGKKNVVLGLPGGRSIAGIYEIFKQAPFNWTNVHFFLVDERLVPIDSPDSNYKLIMESFGNALIQQGKSSPANFHPFHHEQGVAAYTAELQRFGGFDIILLGTGEDGHCAALFPNHPSISNSSMCFFTLNDSPKMPKDRMTASRQLLLSAKVGFAFFIGNTKRDALQKFLNNKTQITQCPIKLVNNLPNSYEFTDIIS